MISDDSRLQSRLQQRDNSMQMLIQVQQSIDPFLMCDSFAPVSSSTSPLEKCIEYVRLTSFKWHREFIMRGYRRASIRPLFDLTALWKSRLESDPDGKMTIEMYECSKQAAVELQNRALLDSNDRMAERRSANINRNGGTATAPWEEDEWSD